MLHPPDWPHLEPAWKAINPHADHSTLAASLANFPTHIQHFFAAEWFHCELQNGGLHQFFHSMACLAPHSARALRAIGFPAAADALAESEQRLGGPFNDPRAARTKLEDVAYDDPRLSALEGRIAAALTNPHDGSDLFESTMTRHAQRFIA